MGIESEKKILLSRDDNIPPVLCIIVPLELWFEL